MNKYLISFLMILLISFNSCETDDSMLMPTITGKAYEIVLVMEDGFWKSTSGEEMREIFAADMEGLTQSEPVFDLAQIPSSAFNNLFRTHRNIFRIDINPENRKESILYSSNVYAKPQLVVDIKVGSAEKLKEVLQNYGPQIRDRFIGAELARIISNYKSYEEIEIGDKMKKHHALYMTVPKGYVYDVEQGNFAWISLETPKHSQGLFLYYYDYVSEDQLKKENLIAKRNFFLRKYVPGPIEGTYMSTQTELPIESREFIKDSLYMVELRGLWELAGPDFMGGPFVSRTTVDTLRQRVVTVEGYVYAPKEEKRNYIRQLEAILNSLEILPLDESLEVNVK